MKLAPPRAGDVIRYAYLWADEVRRGQEEARKDRPSLVLAIAVQSTGGETEVLAVAVTHVRPRSAGEAVALPKAVKTRLGLDDEPSWIVTTEANAFVWPGPDVRPVPGRSPATVIYGRIPEKLLQEVARSFLANRAKQRARMVPRSG